MFLGILTNVDSDEPVQPPFKFRNSKRCSISSLTELLLVTHTTLLGISCRRSYYMFLGILTNVDSDEPVQPPFKFRNSK